MIDEIPDETQYVWQASCQRQQASQPLLSVAKVGLEQMLKTHAVIATHDVITTKKPMKSS